MWRIVSCALMSVLLFAAISLAQQSTEDDADRISAERFATILERNPRRGTAFDKVYGYHLERGSLDDLLKTYQQQAEQRTGADASARWMIVGLIEAQRSRDAEAIRAYQKAEELQPTNALAPYYLGQLLGLTGQSDQAAAALERAIQLKPSPVDLMEMYLALGRIHQRSQKRTEALKVWTRWEQQFPNDARVQEQIANTLLEEEDFEAALPRFEALARAARDKYRQSQFQVEIAEIKIRLGQIDQGIQELEAQLGQLNPDNWLYRDVRRRIEATYLKRNDEAGLLAYYEEWLNKNPEDLDAISRVAKLSIRRDRGNQPEKWLLRGLKLAPSNAPLRRTLIGYLIAQRRYSDAIEQYEELDRREPNNPDTIRDWGRLILQDSARPLELRQQQAGKVWEKLLIARPNDAHAVLQVADLFRQANMTDSAIKLFRRAIELAPEDVQYREYLGEYLFTLKRREEALQTWREMATESRATAPNQARLAEVLSQFDLLTEAITVSAEASRRDAKNLDLQFKHARLLSRANQHEQSLQHLMSFRHLLANDEERERWLERQLAELKALDRLSQKILDVYSQQKSEPKNAENWYWLARAYEANIQPSEAAHAARKAVELNPESIPYLMTAARLHESQKNLRPAIEMYHKLATINRRGRVQYLRQIITLEERLGRRDKAIQAGRELVAIAPGNPEANEFFSQLCFRLGRKDEGLQALRMTLRSNPSDIHTILRLASALSEHQQSSEAAELLWRAFDRAPQYADRLVVVQKLATILKETDQLSSLYSRLERESREPSRQREMTIYLAKAYETAGELQSARQQLEPLVTDESRDTELLEYARTLAQRQPDFPTAIRLQRQLAAVTGNESDRMQLIHLLMSAGQSEQAIELLVGLDENRQLTADILQVIDGLDRHGRTDQALGRVQFLRKRFPEDWELLYREAAYTKDTSRATELFLLLLLRRQVSPDTDSIRGRSNQLQFSTLRLPLVERFSELHAIETAMLERKSPRQNTLASRWYPADYGEARIFAWFWLFDHRGPAFVSERFPQLEQPKTYEDACERMIVQTVTGNKDQVREAARQAMLSSPDDIEAKLLYVQLLTNPLISASPVIASPQGATSKLFLGGSGSTKVNSLAPKQLEEAVSIYREIAARPELVPYNVMLLTGLTRELNLAAQHKLANDLITDACKQATTRLEVAVLLFMQRTATDRQNLIELLDRLIALQDQPVQTMPAAATRYSTVLQYASTDQLSRQLLPRIQSMSTADQSWAIWSRYVRLSARHAATRPQISGVWQLSPGIVAAHAVSSANARNPARQKSVLVAPKPTTVRYVNSDLPALVFDKDATTMFAFIAREFRTVGRSDSLGAMIDEQIAQASDPIEKLYWQHTLAELLWYGDRRSDALNVLSDAIKPFPLRQDLKYGLVQQYEVNRQFEQAFDLLETVVADSFAERRELNWTLFRIAVESKEPTRIRRILEQVSEGDIPDTHLVPFAREMAKQGMGPKAEAMLIQATKHQPKGIATSRALMDAQFASGLTDRAAATAHEILQDLDHMQAGLPAVRQVNGLLVEYQYGTVSNPAAERQACYWVLNAAGQLDALIDQLEVKLEVSRDPEETLDRLKAMYTAQGNAKRVELLGIQKQKLNLSKPADRLGLAIKYLETGLEYQAMEQLQILIKSDPEYLASRIRPTLQRCETSNNLEAFTDLILQLDWGQTINQLLALPTAIEQISQYSELRPIADQLFLKTWTRHPERRVDLLQFFSENWWKLSPDIEHLSLLAILAGPEATISPWTTFGRTLPNQQDKDAPGVTTVLNRLLSIAQKNGRLEDLAAEAEKNLKQHPDWTAGEVLLALIDLRRGRIREGAETLNRLRPKLEPIMKAREFMAWEIGQELIRHHECLDAGAGYLLIAHDMTRQKNWLSASPGVALLDAYVSACRVPDARALLLAQRSPGLLADNTEVVSRAELEAIVGIGRRLQSLKYPMDAIELYLAAIQHGGFTYREITSALSTALEELSPEPMLQALKGRDVTAPLDLHLFDDARHLRTRWDAVWGKIAKDADTRSRFVQLMGTISEEPQNKVTALTASACVSILGEDFEPATLAINKILEQSEQPPPQTESARSHRRLEQIGLWLIARECLTRKSLASLGEKLGQRALDASRRTERDFHRAILKEWLDIATATEDTAKIARLKAEIDKKP